MGSSISIDKHTTALEDWLQIQSKLQQLDFTATPTTHLNLWRFYLDHFDQSSNSQPVPLAPPTAIFSNDECYLVALVKSGDYQPTDLVEPGVYAMVRGMAATLTKNSLQVFIKKGEFGEGTVFQGKGEYFVYAFFGKRANNILKMPVLSYAYRLAGFLEDPNRVKLIAGGGVFKNNKLQMGSVIPFAKSKDVRGGKSLNEYKYIHVVSQLLTKSEQNYTKRRQFSLFSVQPQQKVPLIQSQPFAQIQKQTKLQLVQNFMPTNKNGQSTSSRPANVPPIKPPMLKLALKPYEDPTYEQMDEQQKNQKLDIRATARHQLKMQKFSNDCSLILQGLYLSGEKMAKDESILKKHNISEIVNCAGDYCPNWFESVQSDTNPNAFKYKYLTFFLKDSQNENIQCLFYRVIEFIDQALLNKRNVLVHCIQGISRSVTFVIAYLIMKKDFDYKRAQAFVKQRRGIACPNNGFMVELIQFHKRLQEPYDSLPSPRVFLVSSHCQETPNIITARMLKHRLFDKESKKCIGLDERGVYIVHAENVIYLWVGTKCEDQIKMKIYWEYAQDYVNKLQQFQKGPLKIKAISQGRQAKQFLSLWGIQQVPKQYQNPDYDRLFNQMKPSPKPGYLRKHYERQDEQIEEQFISKLFIYPDNKDGLGVFELDDLTGFCFLVKADNEKIKGFLWRSSRWEGGEDEQEQFVDRVIEQNYASYQTEHIELVNEGEQVEDMSEQFINCFS